MCFTRQNLKPPEIADKNIVSYKLLIKESRHIASPFKRRYKWKDKNVRTARLENHHWYNVYKGFHSFIDIEKAVRYGRRTLIDRITDCHIYKMIIPKGAKYYKNRTQYASDKIRLASMTPIQQLLKNKYYVFQ